MPISLKCPECGKALKAGGNLAGKKCRCPHCQAVLIVPSPASHVNSRNSEAPLARSSAPEKPPSPPAETPASAHAPAGAAGTMRASRRRFVAIMSAALLAIALAAALWLLLGRSGHEQDGASSTSSAIRQRGMLPPSEIRPNNVQVDTVSPGPDHGTASEYPFRLVQVANATRRSSGGSSRDLCSVVVQCLRREHHDGYVLLYAVNSKGDLTVAAKDLFKNFREDPAGAYGYGFVGETHSASTGVAVHALTGVEPSQVLRNLAVGERAAVHVQVPGRFGVAGPVGVKAQLYTVIGGQWTAVSNVIQGTTGARQPRPRTDDRMELLGKLVSFGDGLREQGKHREALSVFRLALEFEPNDAAVKQKIEQLPAEAWRVNLCDSESQKFLADVLGSGKFDFNRDFSNWPAHDAAYDAAELKILLSKPAVGNCYGCRGEASSGSQYLLFMTRPSLDSQEALQLFGKPQADGKLWEGGLRAMTYGRMRLFVGDDGKIFAVIRRMD